MRTVQIQQHERTISGSEQKRHRNASGFNELERHNFIAAVQRRLEFLEERGIQITRNHVRAAGSTELAQ